MKRIVLTFGLISGLIISVLMGGAMLFANKFSSGHSMGNMLIGYTMMVASFLLIYFGIRSYRDNTLAGQISFGRAFDKLGAARRTQAVQRGKELGLLP